MTGSAMAARKSNVLSMLGILTFASIATLLTRGTTIQIVDIPIIIAMLLALLAGQAWGFWAGLVVAAYPSVLLASNGLAMTAFAALLGPFAVSTLLRKRGLLLAPGVLIFHAATALVIALHPQPFIDAEPGAALFFYLRDAAGSLLIAALADLFLRSFTPTNFPPWFSRRKHVGVGQLSNCMTNLNIALLLVAGLVWESQFLQRTVYQYHDRFAQQAELLAHKHAKQNRSITEVVQFDATHSVRVTIVPANVQPSGLTQNCLKTLAANDTNIADDRAFVLLRQPCERRRILVDGLPVLVVGDFSTFVAIELKRLLRDLSGIALIITFIGFYIYSLTRMVSQSVRSLQEVIGRFGEPDLAKIDSFPIAEIDQLTDIFIATNNRYVTSLNEKRQLRETFQTLQRSIALRIITDIRFNPATGQLSFAELHADDAVVPASLTVHPTDIVLFVQVSGTDDALVEFREVSASEHSQLVTLRRSAGANAWHSGVIVEVRQPMRTRELLRHNARLIDLGAMASAICHELKQPLFTIALANASLQRLLAQEAPASRQYAQERTTAIATQVSRAREIIDRIANYGRVTMNGITVITPREAFDAALGLLAPTAVGQDVRVSATQTGECGISASRVALEQVMVNALQNSFDAIAEARGRGGRPAAGLIEFEAHEENDNVVVRLSDDGIGIEDAAATLLFEPFFTTKAEKGGSGLGLFVMNQIVMEANGHIELRSRQPYGAILEMTFPKAAPSHDD